MLYLIYRTKFPIKSLQRLNAARPPSGAGAAPPGRGTQSSSGRGRPDQAVLAALGLEQEVVLLLLIARDKQSSVALAQCRDIIRD